MSRSKKLSRSVPMATAACGAAAGQHLDRLAHHRVGDAVALLELVDAYH